MARQISVLGIDIAKLVFHVVGMNESGHVVLRKRIARSALLHFIATLPPALIGVAAPTAQAWGHVAPRRSLPHHERHYL
jgi:transposase